MTLHAVGNASPLSVRSLSEPNLNKTWCSDFWNQIIARGYFLYRLPQQISQKQQKLSVEFVGPHKQHIGFNGLICETLPINQWHSGHISYAIYYLYRATSVENMGEISFVAFPAPIFMIKNALCTVCYTELQPNRAWQFTAMGKAFLCLSLRLLSRVLCSNNPFLWVGLSPAPKFREIGREM